MSDRVVRASILTSESVCRLGWAAEVFYRRLMSVVDDFGRYDARLSVLRASLYPLQLSSVSEPDIEKHLADCASAGLVRGYVVDGKRYLEVQKFNQRLRALRSKWPSPVDHPPPLTSDSGCCQVLSSADTFVSSTVSDSASNSSVKGEFEGKPNGHKIHAEPNFVALVPELLNALGVLYGQPASHWPGDSAQRAALDVLKRPAWKAEKDLIVDFRRRLTPRDRHYQFANNLTRLLEQWPEHLDRARVYQPANDYESRKGQPAIDHSQHTTF